MKLINKHFEWMVFLVGLILLANLDPDSTKESWCLIDAIGFTYCPGEGLGHSISYFFRGDLFNALKMHLMGPIAVVVMGLRIGSIWYKLIKEKLDLAENNYGKSF